MHRNTVHRLTTLSLKTASAFLLVLLVVVNIGPIFWGILTSIKPNNEIFAYPPKLAGFSPTLEHYIRVMQKGYVRPIVVSLFNSAMTIAIATLLASFAAFGFDRYTLSFRNAMFFVVVLGIPLHLGNASLLIPSYLYLAKLGLTDKWYTLIILYTGYRLPMATWVLKGTFEAIPREIDEAAKIEGCGDLHILFRFLLPLAKPGIAAISILAFIGTWNEFITASVMVNSPELRPVQLAIYNFMGYYGIEWGPLMASASLAIVPIIIVFTFLGKMLISGLTAGALKS